MVVSHFSIAHAAALFSVVTDYIAVFCCRACDINGQQGRPQRICILEGKSWRIWMIFVSFVIARHNIALAVRVMHL